MCVPRAERPRFVGTVRWQPHSMRTPHSKSSSRFAASFARSILAGTDWSLLHSSGSVKASAQTPLFSFWFLARSFSLSACGAMASARKLLVKLRKAAQETDPAKRTYGEQMCKKVMDLCDRWESLQPTITTVTADVIAAYTEHERKEKAAQAAAAAAEAAAAPAAPASAADTAAPISAASVSAPGTSDAGVVSASISQPSASAEPTGAAASAPAAATAGSASALLRACARSFASCVLASMLAPRSPAAPSGRAKPALTPTPTTLNTQPPT